MPLLRNASVIDGTGADAFIADVLIDGDRIAAIDDRIAPAPGTEVINLNGLTLCPGFIDMHSHSDLQILANPDHVARVTQGITTEVLGQDGLSYAPVTDASLTDLRSRLRGWNDDPEGFDWNWRSVGEYLARLERGIAINAAYLVPQGTVRMNVIGTENRRASGTELDAMRAAVRRGMHEGAVGMSTGLTYVPSNFADTDELVALCEVVAEFDGYLSPHHRNYGATALEGYRECAEIARRSGVRLHLTHAHLSFASNVGKLPEYFALLHDLERSGIEYSLDTYPYTAAMSTLVSQLPSWAQEGDAATQLARLQDPATRARIIDALNVTGSDGHHDLTLDWSTIHIAGTPGAPDLRWLTTVDMATGAARLGVDPAALCLDVLVATALGAPCVLFIGIDEHIDAIMQHPQHTVGTDGILVGDRPHPRSWGTFPRILETYVRSRGVLTLTEAIRHMTSSPARILRTSDRGIVAVGKRADLVVFSPETITDTSTYEHPRSAATGIEHVLINGEFALRSGTPTGLRPGRVLRGRQQPVPASTGAGH